MTESRGSFDIRGEIHRDLRRLRRERGVAAFGYVALLSVFLGFIFLSPEGEHALERNPSWYVALLLMFLSSVGGAALAMGFPLVSRARLLGAGGVILTALVGALLLVMDFQHAGPEDPWAAGAECFIHCTMVSGVAMIILGFLSGRLWRRFPDPGWVLALGLTAVGLSALHMQCGGSDPIHLLVFHLGPVLILYGVARGLIWLREFVLRND